MTRNRADWSRLTAWLHGNASESVTVSWEDLNRIVGALPESAVKHQHVWWRGDRPNTRAWRNAGYELERVDLGRSVTFRQVHRYATSAPPTLRETPSPAPRQRRKRVNAHAEENLEALTANFATWVSVFEQRQAFPGPSLYFHERAIARRRTHETVAELLADNLFLEYVYAVLPAWGMHRMGPAKAKVGEFAAIAGALREQANALEEVWRLRITDLSTEQSATVATTAWEVIAHAKVSTSRTQLVAGSKALHHLLPDLIPPIDRQYTFMFFTGQRSVANDRQAFLDWYPELASVGKKCRESIQAAINNGGFMATGEAKVIDNAIMGFMQARGE